MIAPSTEYFVRAAAADDLDAYVDLKRQAGTGFTSIAIPDEMLGAQLRDGAKSFAATITAPAEERYFLALVHRSSGEIVGMAQVKAAIGIKKPFFNFRLLKLAQSSPAAARRFDMEMLALVNEFAGCAEVGSLFVKPQHRVGGVGRALAQARYMLMAAAPERFGERVISELRGFITPDGVSPFFEHLCRPFFRMSFDEADRMSATSDNQFIADLTPKHPIYVDLLPKEARDVIGKCHPEGVGAQKLLVQEGFRYEGVIDIFDGGPLMTAPRDSIRTRAGARLRPVRAAEIKSGALGLIAQPLFSAFHSTAALIEDAGDHVRASGETLDAIGVKDGAEALVWLPDGP
jgi:arginine N-succinyltransferase